MRAAQARLIIGSRMRELRRASGVTVNYAADLSGWDKGHLSRVERGHSKPSQSLVAWYDDAFGAEGALLRQLIDLEAAVRLDRETTLRDAHARIRLGRSAADGVAVAVPSGAGLGGSVPIDFSPDDRSLLVGESVPDGTLMEPGQSFEKSWTLLNAGSVDWRSRWLTRHGCPGVAGRIESVSRVGVGDAAPGQVVVIEVPMVTPTIACAATAYFKITDDAGRPYFPFPQNLPLHCTVLVELIPGGTWIKAATQGASVVHDSPQGRSNPGQAFGSGPERVHR